MKKFLSLLMTAVLVLAMAGCTSNKVQGTREGYGIEGEAEIIVFAAASMTETLEEIAIKYKAVEPRVKLTFNFDSSGTLKTQLEEGALCDLFISAGEKQMDQLDISASKEVNEGGLDFIDSSTRVNLLENRIALVVPEGNPKNITSFEDLAKQLKEKRILLSMGNSDVPVGQYTEKLLKFYGLDKDELAGAGCITFGTNVKEVTTQVKEGSVDAGVVYCTDAFSAGLTTVDFGTKEMCGQVIYPAAVVKNSKASKEAGAFLEYLQGEEAMKIFEKVGFVSVK